MIHFTCDCCQRDLDPNEELRYVVKMEIYAAMEPVNADELDEDSDHLLEIHEILERQLDIDNDQIGADVIESVVSIFVPIVIGNSSKTPWDETPCHISASARINAALHIINAALHIINAALHMAVIMFPAMA